MKGAGAGAKRINRTGDSTRHMALRLGTVTIRFEHRARSPPSTDLRGITVDPASDPQFQMAWAGRRELIAQRKAVELANWKLRAEMLSRSVRHP